MPKNEELTADILALDPNAEVEGLTNPKLVALLKELRAKKYVADKQPEIEKVAEVGAKLFDVLQQGNGLELGAPLEDDAPTSTSPEATQTVEKPTTAAEEPELTKSTDTKGPEPTQTVEEPTKFPRVVEGKSITSKRGVLGPGVEVRPEYFVGGDETIQSLKEKGMIK